MEQKGESKSALAFAVDVVVVVDDVVVVADVVDVVVGGVMAEK